MSGWPRAVLLAVTLMMGTWALLVLLARRLPPGLLRDLAGFVPACVTTIRRLGRDPRVPRRAKVVVALAGLWLLSPIDLVPEFLPVIGPLDDLLVVALALRYAARQVPREVLVTAWPGEPRLLEHLIGGHASHQLAHGGPALASEPTVSCEAGSQRLLWDCSEVGVQHSHSRPGASKQRLLACLLAVGQLASRGVGRSQAGMAVGLVDMPPTLVVAHCGAG
jgi:uncharacterized membrane protein YkvA (DUF1232 family)